MLQSKLFFKVKLRNFCEDYGAVLISPVTEEDSRIVQVGPDGRYELMDTEGMIGSRTRAKNSRCLLGMGRKGNLLFSLVV